MQHEIKFHKILGLPGAGKTTYIANQIIKLIDNGTSIENIMFTTYSRSASRAIYEKLKERGINRTHLNNFGTVYSLANRVLGFSKPNYITIEDYETYARMMQLDFDTKVSVANLDSIDDIGAISVDGKAESNAMYVWFSLLKCMYADDDIIIEKIRNRAELKQEERVYLHRFDVDFLVSFYKGWELYKRKHNRWEYEDLLQIVYKNKLQYHRPIQYIFIDETHDFGKLQMKVLEIWWNAPYVKEVVACYDPMQTIYRFTGSNPQHIENIRTDDYHVLKKSYRVPEQPWDFARYLSESIGEKTIQDVESSGKQGTLTIHDTLSHALHRELEGTTYILARTNAQVREAIEQCSKMNIPVIGIGRTNTVWNYEKFKNIYNLFVKLLCDENPTLRECQDFISELKARNTLKRGVKTQLATRPELIWNKSDDKIKVFFNLFENIKNVVQLKQHIQSTNDFSLLKREYIRHISKHDGIIENIPFFAGTLHASKGLQANNIIIMDYYPRNDSRITDETKLIYVGITRTIDNCFIIRNEGLWGGRGFIEEKFTHYKRRKMNEQQNE